MNAPRKLCFKKMSLSYKAVALPILCIHIHARLNSIHTLQYDNGVFTHMYVLEDATTRYYTERNN